MFRAEKERELGHAYSEIKGLKVTEALKDKAIAEVNFFNVASILKVLPSAKGENPIRKIQDTYAPRIKQFLDLNTKRIL